MAAPSANVTLLSFNAPAVSALQSLSFDCHFTAICKSLLRIASEINLFHISNFKTFSVSSNV